MMTEQRGRHFDPELLDHFLAALDKIDAIRLQHADSSPQLGRLDSSLRQLRDARFRFMIGSRRRALSERGGRRIVASTVVAASPETVFGYLSVLDNHWELMAGAVQRLDSDDSSSVVRLNGPFGIRRTVRTRLIEADPPRLMVGSAQVGSGARGTVSWSLAPVGAGTRVELAATADRAGRRERLLLELGGRAWFRRRFRHALSRAARRFAAI